MRVIVGGIYYPTLNGSSVRITRAASDPVPTCTLNLVDNTSSISVQAMQEILVLDDQVYPNPTVNMLLNPSLNPYTTSWLSGSATGITLSQNPGGGIQFTASNAAIGQPTLQSQFIPGGASQSNTGIPIAGQQYVFSVYAQAASPVAIGVSIQIAFYDLAGRNLSTTNYPQTIPGPLTLTRYSITVTAPANVGYIIVAYGLNINNATNSGTITFTQPQFEPLWFPNLVYPTPWCGPLQTNCQQLPLNLWIRQYRKFAGFVTHAVNGAYKGNVRTVQVDAVGYAWLCGTIFCNDTFTNTTDSSIIASLLLKYLLSNGTRMLNATNVVQGVTLSNLQSNWDDLRTVFDNLAAQSGFYWTFDYYWNAIYAPPGYFSMPITLIADNSGIPDMVTTFPAYEFSSESDFTQPGSTILVLGSGTNVAEVIDPSVTAQLGITSGYTLPTGTSWMRKVNESTLQSVTDCTNRGMAELLAYDYARNIYHLKTNVELIAAQSVRVYSKTDALNGTSLLLQQVTATWLGTDETLHDVWQYSADLGATNRAATHIISRIFRNTTRGTSAPAISTTTLAVLEQLGITDQIDANSSYAMTILADSPLAYYRLGEPPGFSITTAYDWSGNGYNGTYVGGFTLGAADAIINDTNTAVTFDGSTGWANLVTNVNGNGQGAISIELWTNLSTAALASFTDIFTSGTEATNTGYLLFWSGTTALIFEVGNGTTHARATFSTTAVAGTWQYIVGTYNGSNVRLFVNGSVAATTAFSGTISASAVPVLAATTGHASPFPGSIDETAVYSSALNTTQILKHLSAGTGRPLSQLYAASSLYAATVLADMPLAYYRLGEQAGLIAYDWGGSSYNGTLTGGVTLDQSGAIFNDTDTSLLFDGSTGYISLPTATNGNGYAAFSIEGWFKLSTTTLGSFTNLLASGTTAGNTGYQLFWSSNTVLELAYGIGLGTGTATYTVSAVAGAWWHIVGTFDGSTIRLYVNGVLRATASIAGTILASLNPIIGANVGHAASFFPGDIDEVAMYPVALSASRITAHYNVGTLGHP